MLAKSYCMILEIKVPSPGESVTEVEIGRWLVEDGALIKKGQEIAEVESDKATLTIVADEAGKITIKVFEGKTIAVGEVACLIDTSFAPVESEVKDQDQKPAGAEQVVTVPEKITTDPGKNSPGGRQPDFRPLR